MKIVLCLHLQPRKNSFCISFESTFVSICYWFTLKRSAEETFYFLAAKCSELTLYLAKSAMLALCCYYYWSNVTPNIDAIFWKLSFYTRVDLAFSAIFTRRIFHRSKILLLVPLQVQILTVQYSMPSTMQWDSSVTLFRATPFLAPAFSS